MAFPFICIPDHWFTRTGDINRILGRCGITLDSPNEKAFEALFESRSSLAYQKQIIMRTTRNQLLWEKDGKDKKNARRFFSENPLFLVFAGCEGEDMTERNEKMYADLYDERHMYKYQDQAIVDAMDYLLYVCGEVLNNDTLYSALPGKLSPLTKAVPPRDAKVTYFGISPLEILKSDYTEVIHRGIRYEFSLTQARAVKIMHEFWKDGRHSWHQKDVLKKLYPYNSGKRPPYLRRIFAGDRKDYDKGVHPAWGKLIKMVQPNYYTLDLE